MSTNSTTQNSHRHQRLHYIIFIIACIITYFKPAHAHVQPLVLQPPHGHRSDTLKYGQTACVSETGRHLIVGANGFKHYRGAVYLYSLATADNAHRLENWRRTLITSDESQPAEERSKELRPQARGSGFGFSCAFSSSFSPNDPQLDPDQKDRTHKHANETSTFVVGAPGHDIQRGAVYMFKREKKRPAHWKSVAKLVGTDRRSGDFFGWAVAADKTCNTIAVSARGRRANNGQVIVFKCTEECAHCTPEADLSPPDYTDSLGPRGIRIRNNFGTSLALSRCGRVLAVGSTGFEKERGAVYIYQRTEPPDADPVWKMTQRLESPTKAEFGFFGFKVALDGQGLVVAVGADGEDDYTGAVYVFERDDLESEFMLSASLRADDEEKEDNFGGSVAVSSNGQVIAIGAPGTHHGRWEEHGVMYVYERIRKAHRSSWDVSDTMWLPREQSKAKTLFAWTVGVSGDGSRLIATAPDWNGGIGLAAVADFKVGTKRSSFSESAEDSDKEEL